MCSPGDQPYSPGSNCSYRGGEGEGGSAYVIWTRAPAKDVFIIPGTVFHPSERKSAYVRVSYSISEEGLADEALGRLANVVREVFEGNK